MKSIVLVGEDALSCALGARLIAHVLPEWQVPIAPINTGGVTRLRAALPRYRDQLARQQPVLCIADTDRACARTMLDDWLPHGPVDGFMLRLAVSEAEVWVMADRSGFAKALGVAVNLVPTAPEALPDAKREVLKLATRSTRRAVKEAMVRADDPTKPGSGYNLHLCNFVSSSWDPAAAAERSDSLLRAKRALARLA